MSGAACCAASTRSRRRPTTWRDSVALARCAIDGGARLVQYRAKRLPARARLRQAQALLDLCRGLGMPFIVNDDLALAIGIAADGVHLGRDDGDPRDARARLPEAILGVSCYDDPGRALAAAEAGADYVGIGSVFPSATKPLRRALGTRGDRRGEAAQPRFPSPRSAASRRRTRRRPSPPARTCSRSSRRSSTRRT